MMNRMAVAAFLILFSVALASAQEAKKSSSEEPFLPAGSDVRVQALSQRGALMLRIATAPSPVQGLRLYSEPSHTLIFAAADLAFLQTASGKAWRQPGPHLTMTTDAFPAGTLLSSGVQNLRPASDDRVALWMRMGDSERQVFDRKVGAGDFDVTATIPPVRPSKTNR